MAKEHRIKYKDKIIEMGKSGINLSTIAEKLNLNRLDVKIVFQENDLYEPRKKLNRNNPVLQEKAVELYLIGNKSLAEIECELDFPRKEISKLLKSRNIPLRKAGNYNQKYSIKHDSFSNYTPESVYWAGFIAGDGCVYSHGLADRNVNNYLNVSLEIKDRPHLERLQDFLEYDGVIYDKKNNKASSLTVNSIQICEDLLDKYNISNNKTYDYIPPEYIPKHLVKYFILGLIDADGSVLRHKRTNRNPSFRYRGDYVYQIGFTGTYETCEFVRNFFNSKVKIHTRHKDRDNNNHTVLFQGNEQVLKYCSKLYDEHTSKFCLQRKYKNYELLREEYSRL